MCIRDRAVAERRRARLVLQGKLRDVRSGQTQVLQERADHLHQEMVLPGAVVDVDWLGAPVSRAPLVVEQGGG
eukprot:2795512-Alexandrium_andersonii.AAC.1